MPLTPQDVDALSSALHEDTGHALAHCPALVSAVEAALSSASATEAALRAEVERLTRERDAEAHNARVLAEQRLSYITDLRAAESHEAALRGGRDEACEALREALVVVEVARPVLRASSLRPEDADARWDAMLGRWDAVLARIRKETPDHE